MAMSIKYLLMSEQYPWKHLMVRKSTATGGLKGAFATKGGASSHCYIGSENSHRHRRLKAAIATKEVESGTVINTKLGNCC